MMLARSLCDLSSGEVRVLMRGADCREKRRGSALNASTELMAGFDGAEWHLRHLECSSNPESRSRNIATSELAQSTGSGGAPAN
jgi:hypothetical protein